MHLHSAHSTSIIKRTIGLQRWLRMESTCHASIIKTCAHLDPIETLFKKKKKWAMVVHAYSPSKVEEGRSQGLLASKVPMVLCSIWETKGGGTGSDMNLQDDT